MKKKRNNTLGCIYAFGCFMWIAWFSIFIWWAIIVIASLPEITNYWEIIWN